MSAPERAPLPCLDELPLMRTGGYDPEAVRAAFEAFRRHAAELRAQLGALEAADRAAQGEETAAPVRVEALQLIRAAAEFADTVERDAKDASSARLGRADEEIRRREEALRAREREVESYRRESELLRSEIVAEARARVRALLDAASRDAEAELREAEARANRLAEQSRHHATEVANRARSEAEQALEWARAQGDGIVLRARQTAEQVLRATKLGEPALSQVVDALVRGAQPPSVDRRTVRLRRRRAA